MPVKTPRRTTKTDLEKALDTELSRLVDEALAEELPRLKTEIKELRRRLVKAERGASRGPGPARKGQSGETALSARLTPDSIRALRTKLGISQADLALLVGVTPVAVYFWESARTKPTGTNVDGLIELRTLSRAKNGKKTVARRLAKAR